MGRDSRHENEREREMVREILRRANSFTWKRIGVKCTLKFLLVWTVVLVTISGFFHFYHVHGFLQKASYKSSSGSWYFGVGGGKSIAALSRNVATLQLKVGKAMQDIQTRLDGEAVENLDEALHQLRSEWKKSSNLFVEIVATLDHVNSYLQQAKVGSGVYNTVLQQQPRSPWNASLLNTSLLNSTEAEGPSGVVQRTVSGGLMGDEKEEGEWEEEFPKDKDPLVDFFVVEEIRKYITRKHNRLGRKNFMGANATFASIGHACASNRFDLEQYMDYEVGEYCADDWMLGQKLMVHGCDPLPRRRCIARGPKTYQKPLPVNESIWKLPDDRNVRWDKYLCKSFKCLAGPERKGFFKCNECFNLDGHEHPKWMEFTNQSVEADFLLEEVLNFKPGEIRIGLDFSIGVGTFAARMREHNITIATAALNLGAPFNEFIALRGLLPLYLTVNQRLPFFDNTLDIIHTSLFLDGWIDHQLLDFILLDWDRVIRPGGLLWIDRFFCKKEELDDYLYYFEQLRYKRRKWVVAAKSDKGEGEMWFSAVLEKPPRPF